MKYAYTGEKTIHVCSEFFVYYITLLYLLVRYLGFYIYSSTEGFPGGSDDKESACNTRDVDSTPRSVRSPGEGGSYYNSSIFAWRIPWTEEPGGLQYMGLQRVGHDYTFADNLQFSSVMSDSL